MEVVENKGDGEVLKNVTGCGRTFVGAQLALFSGTWGFAGVFPIGVYQGLSAADFRKKTMGRGLTPINADKKHPGDGSNDSPA